MASNHLRRVLPILTLIVLLLAPAGQTTASTAQRAAQPLPGCTTIYGFDGQTALGGNNEDFNNPLTYMWFIPATPGRFGRVYFGYDDYLVQGGLNDQGVFFDGLALPSKAMPLTSQRPHFPGGDLAFTDEVLSRSANVQDVIDLNSRWNRVGGEWAQNLYSDRYGDSVIIDGDTVLRKQGNFQLATNFRLVDQPNPPYPDERYGTLANMLSKADHFSVALFREALDVAHAEGDYPTLYSQIYELKTGIIHLYLYHDFQHEVVLNLGDELAKGPHIVTLASLFPKNDERERWAAQQVRRWQAGYEEDINTGINPASQGWMSGSYVLQEEAGAGQVQVYLKDDQLYMQKPNQFPIELYPTAADSVFHHFFNGMDLTLTFERNQRSQATGAAGTFAFEPYAISLPYTLTRSQGGGYNPSLIIPIGGGVVVLSALGAILFVLWRRKKLYNLRGK